MRVRRRTSRATGKSMVPFSPFSFPCNSARYVFCTRPILKLLPPASCGPRRSAQSPPRPKSLCRDGAQSRAAAGRPPSISLPSPPKRCKQRGDHGAAVGARSRMNDHSRCLVDHRDLFVLVQHVECNRLRFNARGGAPESPPTPHRPLPRDTTASSAAPDDLHAILRRSGPGCACGSIPASCDTRKRSRRWLACSAETTSSMLIRMDLFTGEQLCRSRGKRISRMSAATHS